MPLQEILEKYWGFRTFRPLQEDIIRSVMEGKDTLALLPTGGGKSICFQVPALAGDGLCLVVSPLIALMKDQVHNLRKKGITALAIFSGMSRKDVINTLRIAGNSNCKFLYVSPERLETNLFKEYLPGLPVSLIAVDEAHCISQWGYDFRPPYLRIAALREELPGVPILALTASATPGVQNDICEKLQFRDHRIFRQSFERPNLSYSVFRVDSKINKLVEILEKVPGTGIVYCRSRKQCQKIAELLRMNGISAEFYHAGLSQEERNNRQQQWLSNETRVMVCTNAFGMGIDKPDVRTVVHVDMPDCLENYYQEAGRAGRDTKQAYAVLLYHENELEEQMALAEQQFPDVPVIRNVYQALMNYLQVPSGYGAGNYYAFDPGDFIKRFSLNIRQVLPALRILEQEEWVAFNEQVFIPPKVQVTAGRQRLLEFENEQPVMDQLVKVLLRTYEGIVDFPASVNELMIAKLLKWDKEHVKTNLTRLHSMGIISYQPQKEDPQIYFHRDRITAGDLVVDTAALNERKKLYEKRITAMTNYVRESNLCRSKYIAAYFGDNNIDDCGNCDNCLRKRSRPLTDSEFREIHEQIIAALQIPSDSNSLLNKLKGVQKEKVWKVINFLQAENFIDVNEKGIISLRR